MHGVAAHLAETADGRLAASHRVDGFAPSVLTAILHDRAKAFDRTGDEIKRSLVRDQLSPFVIISIRQQGRDRDFREFRITVKLLTVGVSELGAFYLEVNEFRAGGIEPIELKTFQQRKLLQ